MISIQDRLSRWEFIRLRCELVCEQEGDLSLAGCLGLRPLVLQAGRELLALGGLSSREFAVLFDPPQSPDPEGGRRFQKPSPPFVFRYDPGSFRRYRPGETFYFELLLMGEAIPRLELFMRLLSLVAERGFGSDGVFELCEVTGLDDSMNLQPLWLAGDDPDGLAPPICSADWWAFHRQDLSGALQLEFVTPARLMSRGRPLFRPGFSEIFPFLLRRITSLSFFHAGVVLLDEVQPLLDAAAAVASSCRMEWQDWRALPQHGGMETGGLLGGCTLCGEGVREISWLLALGELFQVGRGAPFGAGKMRVRSALPG